MQPCPFSGAWVALDQGEFSQRPRALAVQHAQPHAPRSSGPSGEHLQCSKFGKTSKLGYRLRHRRFLIQILPRFEPEAMIGSHETAHARAASGGRVRLLNQILFIRLVVLHLDLRSSV
jgi:hypothetical protein